MLHVLRNFKKTIVCGACVLTSVHEFEGATPFDMKLSTRNTEERSLTPGGECQLSAHLTEEMFAYTSDFDKPFYFEIQAVEAYISFH